MPGQRRRHDGYLLSTDRARVDVDRVHRWLAEQSYWAAGRSRETVERSIAGSRTYAVFAGDGAAAGQVAFARTITDGATFGWLCDVFVDTAHRGRGLGGWLVQAAVEDLTADGVLRVLLATRDAHEVYRRQGFAPIAGVARWMEIDRRPGRDAINAAADLMAD